jgi:pyruvate formate lyase activating enzyme
MRFVVGDKDQIRVCGKYVTEEELLHELLEDEKFYIKSGGGVTFSGGEPFAQSEFLFASLAALKGKLHTAVQTCGYTDSKTFSKGLSLCDYVLYDLKLMDGAAHRHFCGVDNGRILENYRALAASGVPFITRIPLIPGVTDTAENLSAIAAFVREQGVDHVELLPYNRMAGSKYTGLLRAFEPGFDEDKAVELHLEVFENYGIRAKKM